MVSITQLASSRQHVTGVSLWTTICNVSIAITCTTTGLNCFSDKSPVQACMHGLVGHLHCLDGHGPKCMARYISELSRRCIPASDCGIGAETKGGGSETPHDRLSRYKLAEHTGTTL